MRLLIRRQSSPGPLTTSRESRRGEKCIESQPMITVITRHLQRAVAALVLIALSMGAGGCYHHVVRAEGAPPGRYDIYQPNVTDDSDATPRVIDKSTATQLKPSKKAPSPPTPPSTTNP